MERKLFFDDETIIGYSDDIVDEIIENDPAAAEEDESIVDLIADLRTYDWELVKCSYEIMDGSWNVRRLIEE